MKKICCALLAAYGLALPWGAYAATGSTGAAIAAAMAAATALLGAVLLCCGRRED